MFVYISVQYRIKCRITPQQYSGNDELRRSGVFLLPVVCSPVGFPYKYAESIFLQCSGKVELEMGASVSGVEGAMSGFIQQV